MKMINKYIIAVIACSLPITAYGDQDISGKIDTAGAALELVNSYGLKCDTDLDFKGLDGVSSKDCKWFIKNVSDGLFDTGTTACKELNTWQKDNMKPVTREDKGLFRRINQVCDKDKYPHVMKTIMKMQLLQKSQ